MTSMELPLAVRPARFSVRFARNQEEVLETQRLRYRIFAEEMGAQIDGGVDEDRYDPYCRHLLVRDEVQDKLVACTRILTDDRARDAGGFYSESEFELKLLDSLPGRVLEVGRTCVDAEYRGGAVIATLWSGLAGYVTQNSFDYLFGCASIGLEDGGANANAVIDLLRREYQTPPYHRIRPRVALPVSDAAPVEGKPKLPPLIKAYVSLGARACGEAYWDQDFNCADVFMLLNVGELCPRYARRFLTRAPVLEDNVAIAA